MANQDVPAGKRTKIEGEGSKQSPPAYAGNSLKSNARVVKSSKSNLMTGLSEYRGAGK